VRHRLATDDELMQAVVGGDEGAFRELMGRHRGWVRSLARAIVRDEDAAEDLAQEVFCRLLRSAGEYRPRGEFVAWLKRIAVNLGRDELRHRTRRGTASLEEAGEAVAPEAPEWRLLLNSDALQGEMRAAIDALPDEQRLPVVMHYFGGISIRDIAWTLKCPPGTVKSRLFYGLRRIRALLAADHDEGAT
jgi:RNA polymerase sigma-70 factor, ECF subfamily